MEVHSQDTQPILTVYNPGLSVSVHTVDATSVEYLSPEIVEALHTSLARSVSAYNHAVLKRHKLPLLLYRCISQNLVPYMLIVQLVQEGVQGAMQFLPCQLGQKCYHHGHDRKLDVSLSL